MRRGRPIELGEDIALQMDVFRDRFDDQVAFSDRIIERTGHGEQAFTDEGLVVSLEARRFERRAASGDSFSSSFDSQWQKVTERHALAMVG